VISFEQEFKPDVDDIQRYSEDVYNAIALAKAKADKQDQQLQIREREEASNFRNMFKSFLPQRTDKLDEAHRLMLQSHERQKRKCPQPKKVKWI
jgi:hypothetical protein